MRSILIQFQMGGQLVVFLFFVIAVVVGVIVVVFGGVSFWFCVAVGYGVGGVVGVVVDVESAAIIITSSKGGIGCRGPAGIE